MLRCSVLLLAWLVAFVLCVRVEDMPPCGESDAACLRHQLTALQTQHTELQRKHRAVTSIVQQMPVDVKRKLKHAAEAAVVERCSANCDFADSENVLLETRAGAQFVGRRRAPTAAPTAPTAAPTSAPTSPTPAPTPAPTCPNDVTSEVEIHLSDFGCPASDDSEDWIESIYVDGTHDQGPYSNDTFAALHFRVPTNGDWSLKIGPNKRTAGAHRLNLQKCLPSGNCCQEISNPTNVPITAVPMHAKPQPKPGLSGLRRKASDDYEDGDYTADERAQILADGEQTYFWELDSTNRNCYAMATYMNIAVPTDSRFVTDSDVAFAKGLHIRLLKMAVCKTTASNETKCANRKITVSCWFAQDAEEGDDSDTSGWVQCTDADAALAAAAAARP